ncbi:sensor histidine kinase [Arenibacter troitsensis]|uniref:histidine kinase n=1 Tax=Arenibacter troitsensis TaxID=188872 RepID=A0A1X7ITT8_9FLAO|nr:PAS domain S-box protein [Arenibacter troitsensis]MDX1769178.1 PAS domain S-box protein [Arenibacter troitsensis]SMG18531.1 PAS domain S-box-containing protein [Arenibacter troitsensis]
MQAFQKNSEIFNLLSEGVSEGIIVVNTKQIIVATNSSAGRMFGYEKGELLGKPLDTLIPRRFHGHHGHHVEDFIDKSERRQMGRGRDLHGVRKNGEEFPVEAGLNPFKLYNETYVMALVIDITERKIKERELSHWAKIFDESLNEIYVFDANTLHFVNVNKEAQRNMGYKLEEFKAMKPLDIKPNMDAPQFQLLIEPLLKGKRDKVKFETEHQRKDGSVYPVEVHLQLSTFGENEVIVAIILDITERKNYTEKLEKKVQERTKQLTEALAKEKELNELKTRFLSLVSHEFKTPLSSILTSITLLAKYTESHQQEKRDKHVETIKNKVRYLDTILTDFLSVERLDSGKVNYKIETFPLSKIVNEVVYGANMLLKAGQTIQYPENIDDIFIRFDEKTLELALSNLIHNAIKYSPEDTTISLAVSRVKDTILINVIDCGIGIPEEDQKHIFNRYFRAENALLNQGTGIGLNIAKQHLENLGATIEFTSEENKGSIFTIVIPLENVN